ncbi:response regulator [Nocardia blacklockiae]|uniref:response regulator n=1 Tax=Nocardia blacklockiae TaxID=480036 RepID=UPI0018956F37|nr:response regulator [Nocardia blacklockiae]MBF6175822.1 response regulator [Nocardia blacklockiae]
MNTHPLSPERAPQPLISMHDASGPARGRVLVVETHPATAEMALLVLSGAGFDAMGTATGHQAVAAAHWWHPDLVLLDLILPDLPGIQVCRRLQDSAVPIMIVSTETDPDVIASAIAAGACDYLPKPFRTVDLLTRIRSRLSR